MFRTQESATALYGWSRWIGKEDFWQHREQGCAWQFAERLQQEKPNNLAAQSERAMWLVFGRKAIATEQQKYGNWSVSSSQRDA